MTDLIDFLVMVSLPILIFVAVTNVYLTLRAKGGGWRVALPGIGGAAVIAGYCVYWQFNEGVGMATVLCGVAGMYFPQVDAVLSDYARRVLAGESRGT